MAPPSSSCRLVNKTSCKIKSFKHFVKEAWLWPSVGLHSRSVQLTRCVYHTSTGKQQEGTSYSGLNTNFPRGWLFFSYKYLMCFCHWDPKILHLIRSNMVYTRLILQYTSIFYQNHWRSFWQTEIISGAQTGQLLLCLLPHREAFLAQWLIWWRTGGAGLRGAVASFSQWGTTLSLALQALLSISWRLWISLQQLELPHKSTDWGDTIPPTFGVWL